MKKALIVIDYINEIVHDDGKLAGKGYADFVKRHDVFTHLSEAISLARKNDTLLVFVRVGFSESYIEMPSASPLFGKVKEFGVATKGTWATEFHESLEVLPEDVVLTKHRVSAFYGTPLDVLLRNNEVDTVAIAGVATDLAVSSATRDAHDRDYQVSVLQDCCAAATDEDHETALALLSKVSTVTTASTFFA